MRHFHTPALRGTRSAQAVQGLSGRRVCRLRTAGDSPYPRRRGKRVETYGFYLFNLQFPWDSTAKFAELNYKGAAGVQRGKEEPAGAAIYRAPQRATCCCLIQAKNCPPRRVNRLCRKYRLSGTDDLTRKGIRFQDASALRRTALPAIVCDEHQRMPRPMQSVKQLQHAVCCGRIQSCGRLIRRESRTVLSRPPVRLPPAAVVRRKAGAAGDSPDRTGQPAPEPPVRVGPSLIMPRNAPAAPAAARFFSAGPASQQPELLKHKADLLTAQTRPLFQTNAQLLLRRADIRRRSGCPADPECA